MTAAFRFLTHSVGALALALVTFAASSAHATTYSWENTDNGIVCGQVSGNGSWQPVDDEPCFKAQAPHVEWQNSGGKVRCAEVTPQGGLLQFIDSSFCYKRLATKTAWAQQNGKNVCAKVTSSGAIIEVVDANQCLGLPAPAPGASPTPVPGPSATPVPDQGNTTPNPGATNTPGYHWTDASRTMCILYGSNGLVQHMAPPASCVNAQ